MEIQAGLVRSEKYFMWLVQPDMVTGTDPDGPTPDELLEGTKERGLVVGWVPQKEILAHQVGGICPTLDGTRH